MQSSFEELVCLWTRHERDKLKTSLSWRWQAQGSSRKVPPGAVMPCAIQIQVDALVWSEVDCCTG